MSRHPPATLPLGQQLVVERARLVSIETKAEGVLEMIEVEVLGAPRIGPIQKWTVNRSIGHATPRLATEP